MTRPFKLLVFLVVLLLVSGGSLVAVWAQRDDENPVTILGPWTDTEEEHFEAVLRELGIPFDYQGTAAQREVLLSKVQAGEPPDIAIMPGVGELAEYAGQRLLQPLDDLVDEDEYGSPWQSVSRTSDYVYWVPVKADLKSIVWYRPGNKPAAAPAPMESWCIGMGDAGASGWPGSDWIEDLVLQREGPDIYGKWALGDERVPWTGDAVRTAWEAWAGLLRQNRKATGHALRTDRRGDPDEDRNGLLFSGRGGCTLEHQGSFAPAFYNEHPVGLADSAPLLPGGPYQVRAHEVTGDFAALFSDRAPARKLIEKLASAEGQRKWAEFPDVFSANRLVQPKSGRIGDAIAARLTGRGPRCLDASDVMPPALRDAFYEATLLTMARIAAGEDPDIPHLLADLQNIKRSQPTNSASLRTVCSSASKGARGSA
ncbi:extracellular solute-binding protein [Streptomyces sp. TRM68367]|uniref:extracellular solute-binding protein n=1 Tax=Streptomyces sp. TRM68367 TaxID=2758415 RepID=UPI00165A9504|nr:extracellular solute-binding protein [Streptomyces sp. TRM68367]MBC9725304.1 extracellular solute-binding protein [Streptomyces sp. TRM68367]